MSAFYVNRWTTHMCVYYIVHIKWQNSAVCPQRQVRRRYRARSRLTPSHQTLLETQLQVWKLMSGEEAEKVLSVHMLKSISYSNGNKIFCCILTIHTFCNQYLTYFKLHFTSPSPRLINTDWFVHICVVCSVLDPEPTDQSQSTTSWATTGPVAHPKALAEVAQLTCIQKARTWGERQHMTRNAIQRQNRVRQGIQPNFFRLQQPGQRNLCHWDSSSYHRMC